MSPLFLRHIRIVLVAVFVSGAVVPVRLAVHANPVTAVVTLGGLLGLANTVRDVIQTVSATVGEEAAAALADLDSRIGGMIDEISRTYAANLNLTIDQLDNAANGAFRDFAALLAEAEAAISRVTGQAETAFTRQIIDINYRIEALQRGLAKSMEHLILVAGQTGLYLVDRVFHNALGLVAIALTSIFVIVTVGTIIGAGGLPHGAVGSSIILVSLLFVLGSGAIIVNPDVRVFLLRVPDRSLVQVLQESAQQPYIVRADPGQVMLGSTPTPELRLRGFALQPGETPIASINGTPVPVIASADQIVVLDVRQFPPPQNASANVELAYSTTTARANMVVQFVTPTPTPIPVAPPDVTVALRLNPVAPAVGELVTATIIIANMSLVRVPEAEVVWKIEGEGGPVDSFPVGPLEPDRSITITRTGAFSRTGSFTPVVIIDPDNRIFETDENNNSASQAVVVAPQPKRLVLQRYFELDPSDPPGQNVRFASNKQRFDECTRWYDMALMTQCLMDGTLSTASLQVEPGDRILVEMGRCDENPWYVPLKPNCISGGFGKPGIWGPGGVGWEDVFPPDFPFRGKLFQLGIRFGDDPPIPVGPTIDTQYNGRTATLTFMVNDTNLADNEGYWSGTISIWR